MHPPRRTKPTRHGSRSVTTTPARSTPTATVTAGGDNTSGQSTLPGGIGGLRGIAAGVYHACAIKIDDTVACWGGNGSGQQNIPGGLGTVRTLVSGVWHTCVVKPDQTAACWGLNSFGQATVPNDLGTVSEFALGWDHTCALKTDQTVTCWGRNNSGQISVPSLGAVRSIAAGTDHTCAIQLDEAVVCWGYNATGQATVPGDLGTVKSLTAGELHTCALLEDRSVRCWGNNSLGQGTPPPGLRALAVSARNFTTCAIATDGSLQCWGDNSQGQTTVPTISGTWSALPAAPTLADTDPASPGATTTPTVTGSAWEDVLVQLYSTPDCSGSVTGGSTSAVLGGAGISFTVEADTTTQISARILDEAGNSSTCSYSISYTHVTPPADPPEPEPPVINPPDAGQPIVSPPDAGPTETIDPPSLLPPTPTEPKCEAVPRPKRKAGLGLRVVRSGRTLTVRVRGRAKVTVTTQEPCGKVRAIGRKAVRARTTMNLPKLSSGSVVTVRATRGKTSAVAAVRVR